MIIFCPYGGTTHSFAHMMRIYLPIVNTPILKSSRGLLSHQKCADVRCIRLARFLKINNSYPCRQIYLHVLSIFTNYCITH